MIPFKATQGALDAVRLVRFVRSFCVRPNQIASKIAGQPINAQGGYLPYTEWDSVKNICKVCIWIIHTILTYLKMLMAVRV